MPAILGGCQEKAPPTSDPLKDIARVVAENEAFRARQEVASVEMERLGKRLASVETELREVDQAREEMALRLAVLEQLKNRVQVEAAPKLPEVAALPQAPDPAVVGESRTDIAPISISGKVVVIEGDQGKGTGFLCTTEGSLWLYTAAHVISGNKTIAVRDQQDNRFQTFDTMEVADGVDLVRLKISGSRAEGLLLEGPERSPEIGDPIMAIGNSDGTGVVATETGEIRGKGPDSWEVSAEIIPGNSGGPVISRKTNKVIGIVTHLIVGKEDSWAADTRFAEVRRFAARLDRPYKWTTVTPARFLKEYQIISAMDEDTKLGWAAITMLESGEILNVSGGESENARRVRQWVAEAGRLLNSNPQNPIASAASTIKKRGNRYSVTENMRTLQEAVDSRLVLRNELKEESFSWYHRESYRQSVAWRKRLLERFAQ